jgi:hypothetical protein
LVDFGRVGARVDGEEHVALLDDAAVLEMHGGQGARHQGADVDAVDGFQAAGIALPVHDGFVQHLGHLDRRRRGGALRLGGVGHGGGAEEGVTAAGRDDGCENGEHSNTMTRNHDVSLSDVGTEARWPEPGGGRRLRRPGECHSSGSGMLRRNIQCGRPFQAKAPWRGGSLRWPDFED